MSRFLTVALVMVCAISPAFAAIESRDVLKTYFEIGDVPTQEDFVDLIDSVVDVTWEYDTQTSHLLHVQPLGGGLIIHGDDGTAFMLQPGAVIGTSGVPGAVFAQTAIIDSSLNLNDDRYLLGLRFQINQVGGEVTTHYGFIDMSVDGPTSATGGTVHLYGFAYESDVDAPITAFFIPEPGSAAVLLVTAALLVQPRVRRSKR